MTRTLMLAALLAYSTAAAGALASCAGTFRANAVAVLDCTAADLSSQASGIIAQLLVGNWAVLAMAGVDALQCALATAQALPVTPRPGAMGGHMGGLIDAPRRSAMVLAIKTELAKRKGSR